MVTNRVHMSLESATKDPFSIVDIGRVKEKKKRNKRVDNAPLLLREIVRRIDYLASHVIENKDEVSWSYGLFDLPLPDICHEIYLRTKLLLSHGICVYETFEVSFEELTKQASLLAERIYEIRLRSDPEDHLILMRDSHYGDIIEHTGLPGMKILDVGLWFRRKLVRRERQIVEYFYLCMNEVGENGFHYSSDAVVYSRKKQHLNHASFASNHSLCSYDENGNSTLIAFPSPAKNYENNHAYITAKITGLDKFCLEKGLVGFFLTPTLSGEYHPNPKSGVSNWSGVTPSTGLAKLQESWAWIRRRANEIDLTIYGVRVSEPHKDSCPHWHMLAYIESDKTSDFIRLVKTRFPGQAECKLELIDRNKGSGASYLLKYVVPFYNEQKIDGIHLSKSALAVDAHRSTWGGRSIQFFDLPGSKTVWNELRRIKADCAELSGLSEMAKDIHSASIAGDFFKFLYIYERMAFNGVKSSIRVHYKENVNGSRKVVGLIVEDVVFITHHKVWTITNQIDLH